VACRRLRIRPGDGQPFDPDTFSKAFRSAACGIDLGSVRLHDLRHGFASMLVGSLTNVSVVSDLLGHTTPAFTLAVDTHPSEEEAAVAVGRAIARRRSDHPLEVCGQVPSTRWIGHVAQPLLAWCIPVTGRLPAPEWMRTNCNQGNAPTRASSLGRPSSPGHGRHDRPNRSLEP
jgi:hypothetical protein